MEGTDCFCCNLSVCWRNIRAIRGLKNIFSSGVKDLSLWEMISCGSADGFYILDMENLRLHQILFTKGINNDLPMTRWY